MRKILSNIGRNIVVTGGDKPLSVYNGATMLYVALHKKQELTLLHRNNK